MSEREMHQQDLEVIRVVNTNAAARKAEEAERQRKAERLRSDIETLAAKYNFATFPNEETMEDRLRVLRVQALPVLGWAGMGVGFLIAMSHGLCGAEMGIAGGLLCFIRTAVEVNRRKRKEMLYV